MSVNKEARPEDQVNVALEEETDESRKRFLTEKGYTYQLNLKTSNLKTKKCELVKRMRGTLLKRGQSTKLVEFKKEFSEAQILYCEFQDMVEEIKVFANPDENVENIERMVDQVGREWSNFECDIRSEIKFLEFVEHHVDDSISEASKRSSRASKKSSRSKISSNDNVEEDRFQLQKEEAALKAKLAYIEKERLLRLEHRKTELTKLEQERKLEELRLQSELAQNQAKLNVCMSADKVELFDDQDLNSIPPADKVKDMDKFLNSIPVTSKSDLSPGQQEPIYSSTQLSGAQPTFSLPRVENGVHSTLSPSATPFQPHSVVLEKCMDKLVETSSMLVAATMEQNLVNRQLAISGQLPKISIPVFSGDPLEYPTWNSSFSALIDSKPMDAQTKLNFLHQYISGKPKQVVDQYMLIGTEDAYQSARKLLKERYGNCNVVGTAFMNKLENWPKIGVRDAEALRDLSDFLQKIIAARETTPSLAVLDFAKENVKTLNKLPFQIQNKWRGIVQQCRVSKGNGTYPTFSEFASFVKECAERANIPELEELSKTKEFVRPRGPFRRSPKGEEAFSFETHVLDPSKNVTAQGQGEKERPPTCSQGRSEKKKTEVCLFCKEEHQLDECKKFAEKPHKERKDFFYKKFLCLGCASSSQHQVSSCKNRLKCRTCSGNHPTCLHIQKTPKESITNCTNVCTIPEQEGGSDHAMIVPVWVRQVSQPSKEVLQYAVLDDQSNVSFVSQSLCEKLDLQGPPTDLLLTTVQERNVHVPSNRICGVEVLDFRREHAVKLPMMFKRDIIPASRSQIPKASVARKWEHLCPIADELMPYNPSVEISLLIGNNCPSIVRPREVLVGGEDDPYGQRSLMGWGIIGKVCKSTGEANHKEGVCNKVMVKETHEHFAFTTKVKEIINPQKIIKILESDFTESSANTKPCSAEDRRFLNILENGIVKRSDGHYEMPLPLKTDKPSLPFNRELAVKRWHQLLARFKRNPKFLEDYRLCVEGYGQCSYLRLINVEDKAYCSLVIGKSRVAPLKQITVPRLELAAATVSANVSEFLRRELSYTDIKEHFWTDSKIVLGYVNNEAKRFHVYVANRVQQIRDVTNPSSWLYVSTELNPADHASRGLTASQLLQGTNWLTGPLFLWKSGTFQPEKIEEFQVTESDPEVRKAAVFTSRVESRATQAPEPLTSSRLRHMSSWQHVLKAIALCLRLKSKLASREVKLTRQTGGESIRPLPKVSVTLTELHAAEREVLKVVQREHFHDEMQVLKELKEVGELTTRKIARERNLAVKKSSCLYRLDPFLDENGVIRVGGRVRRANLPFATKHPVILPRKSHITDLLIRFWHAKVNHMGRGITQNELRQRGYWVVGGSSAVSNCISKCVTCRKMRGPLQIQKMADLPVDRVEPSAPFSYCAVDFFGPFPIKEKRSEVKRYGVIFTCMASRGVHLETANSLSTSSFINALSRFLNRRGPVRQLRCDQGTNFVGARNELKAALEELDQNRVQEYLVENGCDWIPFQMNVPHASHMGGTWERLIRTVRSALETLLLSAGTQLDDEAFRTFMTEAECIVNSRPLSTNDLNDPEAPEPLTPSHLLTLKAKVVLPPPGRFQRADLYSRKWWRRVQYLANEFWLRWRREFLHSLQARNKWMYPKRNLSVGDVVVSKEDEGPRNQWPLARVVEVYPSEDGCIRKVKIVKADGELDNQGRRRKPSTFLDRPIHKLVLLVPSADEADVGDSSRETEEFPNEEPTTQ